jgi:hypothetical protein
VGDKELTFDFAEGLLKDNLLIVDRETGSVWSQLHGKAVIGPMEGTPLETIPTMQTTWKFWRERHPDTKVMVFADQDGRPYFYRNSKPGSRPPRRTSHDTSTLGLGLAVGEDPIFFPLHELGRATTPFKMELGGQTITVFYNEDGLTAWAENAGGELLPSVLAYQSGWMDFFPQSKSFKAR